MKNTVVALSVVLLVGVAVAMAARNNDAEDNERDDAKVVSLDSVPAPARDALKKLAGSAKLGKIAIEDEDGVKVYEAAWSTDGVDQEASVTEYGDVVETESVVNLDEAPQTVRKAASRSFPKRTKVKIEKKTIVLFELEAEIDGHKREILVSPTGQRVEIEHERDHQEKNEDDDEN